jgi:hypothetical protein
MQAYTSSMPIQASSSRGDNVMEHLLYWLTWSHGFTGKVPN